MNLLILIAVFCFLVVKEEKQGEAERWNTNDPYSIN